MESAGFRGYLGSLKSEVEWEEGSLESEAAPWVAGWQESCEEDAAEPADSASLLPVFSG